MKIEASSKSSVFYSFVCLNNLCKGSYSEVCSSLGEKPLFCKRPNPQRMEGNSAHFAQLNQLTCLQKQLEG